MNFVYQKDQFQDRVEAISLSDILGLLRRNIRLILGAACVFLAIGILAVVLLPKKYEASALVLIDPRKTDFLADAASKDARLLTTDGLVVDSEVEIIRSRELLKRVAARANLYTDPEYTKASLMQPVMRTLSAIAALFSGDSSEARPDGRLMILESFARNITVERVEPTYVLRITYQSQSPARAAEITNLIVEEYLTEGMRAQNDASRKSSDWIKAQLNNVRADVIAADHAVELYKVRNDLMSTQGGSFIAEQQVAEISTRLVAAQADAEGARAKLQAAQTSLASGNYATLSGGGASGILTSLLSARQSEQQDAARILSVYDKTHQGYKQAQARISELEGQIREELQRIVSGLEADYQAATQLSASLSQKLSELKLKAQSGDEREVQLRELEQRAASAKAIYQSMLDALSKSVQQQSFPSVSARVIQQADPPPKWTKPNWKIGIALSLMLGLGTGVGGAFFREGLRSSIHSAREVENLTGRANLGFIPLLPPLQEPGRLRGTFADLQKRLEAMTRKHEPGAPIPPQHERALARSTLRQYHEILHSEGVLTVDTLRAIEIALRLEAKDGDENACVIALGSAAMGEGKSTVATLLAMHLAWGGARVLLADYDFQTTGISARFHEVSPPPAGRTGEAMPPMKFDPVTGLVFMPAPARSEVKREIARVIAEGSEHRIASLRPCFDFIIVDLPPLVHLPHGRILARNIDKFILVVEWDKTGTAVIERALSRLPELAGKLMGTVINKTRLPWRSNPAEWS